MSDDIVTRLMNWSDESTVLWEAVSELRDSKKEIERLREKLWKFENCEMLVESVCEPDWEDGECETCAQHRQAVRGE